MEVIACLSILIGFCLFVVSLLLGFNTSIFISSNILVIGGFIILRLNDILKALKNKE